MVDGRVGEKENTEGERPEKNRDQITQAKSMVFYRLVLTLCCATHSDLP